MDWTTIAIIAVLLMVGIMETALIRMARYDHKGKHWFRSDYLVVALQFVLTIFILLHQFLEFMNLTEDTLSDVFFVLFPVLYLAVAIFYPLCQWTVHGITFLSLTALFTDLYPNLYQVIRHEDITALEEDWFVIFHAFGIWMLLLPLLVTMVLALLNHFVLKRQHRVLSRAASYTLLITVWSDRLYYDLRRQMRWSHNRLVSTIIAVAAFALLYVLFGWVNKNGKRKENA